MGAKEFGRDRGLTARMTMTMFALGLVYVVLIAVAIAAGANVALVVVLFAAVCGLQLLFADKVALKAVGAQEVPDGQLPELHQTVERLCVTANIPKPKLAIVNTPMPNAFAMGRSQATATLCVTTGLLKTLTPEQLEGVLAHELTHIVNRDVLVMTLAGFFASVSALMIRYGFLFSRRARGQTQIGAAAMVAAAVGVYAVSFMLLRALSRYREYAADRGAAVLTGRPSALASALMTLEQSMIKIPSKDLRAAELNAFFIIPVRAKNSVTALFATHPPVQKRIEALARYEAQLQQGR